MQDAEMDKLVVLARGLGTRMRRSNHLADVDARQAAIADTGIKALIPIGRPFLDYVLSTAADAGFRRVCLVIGPEHEAVRRYYADEVTAQRLSFSFAYQAEPKGTADAVAAAESFAAGEPVVVINSDNHYPVEALTALRHASGPAVALFEREAMLSGSNVPEERIQRFAVAKLSAGRLDRIVEKPDDATLAALPKPLWLSMNCWRFGPSIFTACRAIRPSPRGELELPDAVQYSMSHLGESFLAITIRAPVLDLSGRDDIAPVAKLLTEEEVRL